MVAVTMLMLNLSWGNARELGSDRYGVREAASARLEASLPLSLPALLTAQRSSDLETRRRASRLVEVWLNRAAWAGTYLAAMWLVYGPDESEVFGVPHYLNSHNTRWCMKLPRATRGRIYGHAREFTVGRDCEADWADSDVGLVAFVNVLRYRVRGGR